LNLEKSAASYDKKGFLTTRCIERLKVARPEHSPSPQSLPRTIEESRGSKYCCRTSCGKRFSVVKL